jgi:VWFA-related protein
MHAGPVIAGLVLATFGSFVIPVDGKQQPAPATQQQPPPSFRSRVTVVPIDVRVVDRNGKPITGLTQQDFTVSEDGVPQQIVHFSFKTLTAVAPGPEAPVPQFRKPLSDTVTPQSQRIFLLLLGRGRQVGPVQAVDAAMRFVKERLLPQDQVAVLAFNRATDFTTDHAKVIDTLRRYKDKHEWIETQMAHHLDALADVYSVKDIPASLQKEIDSIFIAAGALGSRTLASTGVANASDAADTRRNKETLQSGAAAAERIRQGVETPFDQSTEDAAGRLGMPLDEFAARSLHTDQDIEKMYAGIRYMRYLDGEKHMVLLTPQGLFMPRLESGNPIAALANDARVAIDIIHTYGMQAGAPMTVRGSGSATSQVGIALRSAVPSTDAIFNQRFMVGTSKEISRLTGGTTTAFEPGAAAFARLDQSTREQYLLGYSPTNVNWNGAFRKIAIKVNRKDATVLYRHGYAARREVTPLSREQYLTYSRVANAANVDRPIADLPMSLSNAVVAGAPGARSLTIDVRVQPGAVKLHRDGEVYAGTLETLAFCGDAKQVVIGESWQTLEFKLTESNYQKFQTDGVRFTVRVPLKADASYAKVILYDVAADLVGSQMIPLTGK